MAVWMFFLSASALFSWHFCPTWVFSANCVALACAAAMRIVNGIKKTEMMLSEMEDAEIERMERIRQLNPHRRG